MYGARLDPSALVDVGFLRCRAAVDDRCLVRERDVDEAAGLAHTGAALKRAFARGVFAGDAASCDLDHGLAAEDRHPNWVGQVARRVDCWPAAARHRTVHDEKEWKDQPISAHAASVPGAQTIPPEMSQDVNGNHASCAYAFFGGKSTYPGISIIFSRDPRPRISWISDLEQSSVSARNSISASFAFPSMGGALKRIFHAPFSKPTISLCFAFGMTRMEMRMGWVQWVGRREEGVGRR